jgi:hypothetical protein
MTKRRTQPLIAVLLPAAVLLTFAAGAVGSTASQVGRELQATSAGTLDSSAPVSLRIVTPVAASPVSGSIRWKVVASRPVDHVDFSIDHGPVAWTEWLRPYVFNGDQGSLDTTSLRDGKHTLTAVARSHSGKELANVSVIVLVDNKHPRPAVTANPKAGLGTALPHRLPFPSGKARTFFVDGRHGSDSGRGSKSSPWRTINHALRRVPLAGSIIEIEPGTYYSSGANYAIIFRRHGSIRNPVTLKAAVPGTVTIANSSPTSWTLGAWISNATGLRIRGIKFDIETNRGINVGATAMLIENSSHVEIDRCTFYEVATDGIDVRGGAPSSASSTHDVWIIDNTFRPRGPDPFAQVTGTGWTSDQYFGSRGSSWIYVGQVGTSSTSVGYDYRSGSDGTVIANNLFLGSTAGYDIELGPEARHGYVVNNTFFGNHAGEVFGWSTDAGDAGNAVEFFVASPGAPYATSHNLVVNNIFANLDGHAVAGGSSGAEVGNSVENNLSFDLRNGEMAGNNLASQDYLRWYESVENTIFSTGAGNLKAANPRFNDPAGYDFGLAARSPAIGRGVAVYTPPTDLAGNVRTTADLGAIEHSP